VLRAARKRAGPFPPSTPQGMLSAARAALKPLVGGGDSKNRPFACKIEFVFFVFYSLSRKSSSSY
jgi:hypothetical protein